MTDDRVFLPLSAVDGYRLELPKIATMLTVERLRRERGELVGELSVACGLPGTRATNGTLHVADFNLSSARARTERGRILAERSNTADIDWTGLLEDLVQRVLVAERTGQPARLLRDLSRPATDEDLDVDGFRLLHRHPMTLFGDGGDAKSYLALFLAGRLAQMGLRVLYADWEFAGEDHRDRLERLFGEEMPEVWYVRCERPLSAEADRLRRIVTDERIDYWFADSVAFACDGPPESAEVAAGYFRATRRIGIGSCHIAHMTKAENGDQKPFGSSFWHNGSRATWYVKRAAGGLDENRITIGLFNRKANTGPLARAIGYQIEFGPERTTFTRTNLVDSELADRLPVAQRMQALLAREGSMTMAGIAHELDVAVDTIVKTTKRHEGKRFVRLPGDDGVYRIGLLAEHAA